MKQSGYRTTVVRKIRKTFVVSAGRNWRRSRDVYLDFIPTIAEFCLYRINENLNRQQIVKYAYVYAFISHLSIANAGREKREWRSGEHKM